MFLSISLSFYLLFIFLATACGSSWGQESNTHHSSDPSHCSDNAGSLTSCATRELHLPFFRHCFKRVFPMEVEVSLKSKQIHICSDLFMLRYQNSVTLSHRLGIWFFLWISGEVMEFHCGSVSSSATLTQFLTHLLQRVLVCFWFFFCGGRGGSLTRTYGSFQVRGRTWAVAASLVHSHSNWGIWAVSATYTTAHSNPGSPTHWARPGIEPASSWILVRIVSAASWRELFHRGVLKLKCIQETGGIKWIRMN